MVDNRPDTTARLKHSLRLAVRLRDQFYGSGSQRLIQVEGAIAEYVIGQVDYALAAASERDAIRLAWATRNILECAVITEWVYLDQVSLENLDSWLAKDQLEIHDGFAASEDGIAAESPEALISGLDRATLVARTTQTGVESRRYLNVRDLATRAKRKEYSPRHKLLSKLTHCSPYSIFNRRSDDWDQPIRTMIRWADQYAVEVLDRLGVIAA